MILEFQDTENEMDSASATHPTRELLNQGFKTARSAVRSCFPDSVWVRGNLPEETRRELDAVGSHLVRCLDLLDLESVEGLPLDIWKEIRDELSDTLCGKYQLPEQAALSDVVKRHRIPRQYLFDMVNAADYWIRFRGFETWEQLETFASNLGGSAMVTACHVVGVDRAGFEPYALHCGKAILLTQKLASCFFDLKSNRNFLAQEDLKRFNLEIPRVKMRQSCPELKQFVRFTAARIERLYVEGGKLLPYLELAGARSLMSLLSMNWRILARLKLEPECIFNQDGILKRRDLIGLKSRHFLGLEGGFPYAPEANGHH